MNIKQSRLKEWVEEELSYASDPEQAVVEYRERLFLGGYRKIDRKKLAVDVDAIAEAINPHGKDTVDVGKDAHHYHDASDNFKWTVEFAVYV
jgi:hypothetical protein